MLIAPPTGPLLASKLRAQPLGSSRAPSNWGRVTALLKWVLAKFFGVVLAVFVDDCYIANPRVSVESAFECVQTAIRLFGFDLGEDKKAVPSDSIVFRVVGFVSVRMLWPPRYRREEGAL